MNCISFPAESLSPQSGDTLHAMTAPELMSLWMRGKAREGLLNMKRASDEAMKSPSARLRALLIPYQQSAMGALERFLEASGVSLLPIGPEALEKAKTICEVAPCDTNDALHLALALTSGCSYAVTKDADWGRVPATLRPVVLQIA